MRLFRRVSASTLLVLASTLGASSDAAAQGLPSISIGSHVRVSTESAAAREGVITAFTSGTLELREEGGGRLSVPLASMTHLDVRRQRSLGLVGFFVGATAGALGAVAYCASEEENCVYMHMNGGRNDLSGAAPLVLGAVGGAVGALVGRTIRVDRWEEVPLDGLRVSLGPGRYGRPALGVMLRLDH